MSNHLKENALAPRAMVGGKPTLLRVTANRYNKVALSVRNGESWINADLTIDVWNDLMVMIELATRSTVEGSTTIHLKKKEAVFGHITVGVDVDLSVFLEVGNNDGGKVRFDFMPRQQYVYLKNNQPIQRHELTRIRALAYVRTIGPMVNKQWEMDYKEEAPQGGGGYQQRPQGGGNNYQQRPQNNYAQNNQSSTANIDGDLEQYIL